MTFDVKLLPIVLLSFSTYYTPIALGFYMYFKRHPNIRYRQPGAMSIVGGCLALCSLTFPMLILTTPRCLFIFVWITFLYSAFITYLHVQISIVIMFKITEILAHPELATRENTARLGRYRMYFNSSVHDTMWVLWNILFLVPIYYPFDLDTLMASASRTCTDGSMSILIGGEFGLMGVIQTLLAYQVSHVVDNFGSRRAIMSSAKAAILLSIFGISLSSGAAWFKWTWFDEYHVKGCLGCVPIHIIFYNHFLIPLRPVIMPRVFTQKIVVLSSAHHSRRDSVALTSFHSFLKHPDGFRAFSEFCAIELTLERLLAWKCMDDYRCAPSYRSAMQVYDECLALRCRFSTPQGERWRQYYEDELEEWKDSAFDSSFYDKLKQDILQSMYSEVFPRFLSDPKCVYAWHEFLSRKRVVEKLNHVMKMVNREAPPSHGPRAPLRTSSNN